MRRALALLPLLVLALLPACGDDEDSPAASKPAAATSTTDAPERTRYPLTIDNCGHELTFEGPPERVVLLSGASVAEVESFIELGIQDSIVANAQSYAVSDDPDMIAAIKAIPRAGLELNEQSEVPREQVLGLAPDLVVSTWAGGFDPKIGSISREDLAKAGINSFVTPVNCAYGDPSARPADKEKFENQSVESSFELLAELGRIFDVQERAAEVIEEQRARMAAAAEGAPAAGERPSVLVAYPGAAMGGSSELPTIFAGGIYDDIIERAGGVNTFAGKTNEQMAQVNAEALASADVDVVVIPMFGTNDDPAAMAAQLFERYPRWEASANRAFASLSDSLYLGPQNAVAVEKIAEAVKRAG